VVDFLKARDSQHYRRHQQQWLIARTARDSQLGGELEETILNELNIYRNNQQRWEARDSHHYRRHQQQWLISRSARDSQLVGELEETILS